MQRAPRLKALAASIMNEFPELEARTEPTHESTDRKVRGTRFVHKGKGRDGTRLIVRDRKSGVVVLDHSSAETYRRNSDVVEWIEKRRVAAGGRHVR